MTRYRSITTAASASLLGTLLMTACPALAQTVSPQATPLAAPDAQQPNSGDPGGIARGVVRPPANVDPGMITPPPQASKPSMPVIKPPTSSR